MTERKPIPEWAVGLGSLTLLYAACFWGFNRFIKEQVYEEQGGLSPSGVPIDEYHHIVPEKMLRNTLGISGKNVRENCIGLGFKEHKEKWDRLAAQGIFYPGVTLDKLDPNTYVLVNRSKHHKRRRR